MITRATLVPMLSDLSETSYNLDPSCGYAYITGTYESMLVELAMQLPEEKQKDFILNLIATKNRVIANAQEKVNRNKIQ